MTCTSGRRLRTETTVFGKHSRSCPAKAMRTTKPLSRLISSSRAQLEAATGRPVDVLAYPAGQYSTLAQVTLQNLGVHVTLSTNPGINTVVKGLPQTLTAMLRFGVTEDLSPEALLEMIQ